MLHWVWVTLAAFAVIQFGFSLHYWWRGSRGLDQWPMPYGRYYKRWLKQGAGDYYEWLAREMGNREPWKTWVEMDKQSRAALHSEADSPRLPIRIWILRVVGPLLAILLLALFIHWAWYRL